MLKNLNQMRYVFLMMQASENVGVKNASKKLLEELLEETKNEISKSSLPSNYLHVVYKLWNGKMSSDIVDGLTKEEATTLCSNVTESIHDKRRYLDKKITTIKLVRERLYCDLITAKKAVEDWVKKHVPEMAV